MFSVELIVSKRLDVSGYPKLRELFPAIKSAKPLANTIIDKVVTKDCILPHEVTAPLIAPAIDPISKEKIMVHVKPNCQSIKPKAVKVGWHLIVQQRIPLAAAMVQGGKGNMSPIPLRRSARAVGLERMARVVVVVEQLSMV